MEGTDGLYNDLYLKAGNATSSGQIRFATYNQQRMVINGSGNLAIGTTSAGFQLDVLNQDITTEESTIRIQRASASDQQVGLAFYTGESTALWSMYTDSGSSDFLFEGGSDPDVIFNIGAENRYFGLGIGTSTPDTILTIANDNWISAKDNAGTSYVNMFKVNASDEIDVGATLNVGPIELEEDSGAITLVNLPVSSTPIAGTQESYSFAIDSNSIMTVYSEADGAGGTDTHRVGIGTTTPSATLHVKGDDLILDIQETITTNMVLTAGNTSGLSYWKDITEISGVTGTGSSGQATFWTDTSIVDGDNDFYWDNSNKRLGIGTTVPQAKLDIGGGALTRVDGTDDLRVKDDIEVNGDIYVDGTIYDGSTNIDDIYINELGDATPALTSDLNIDLNTFVLSYDDNYIGIGSASPVAKLDVEGQIRVGAYGASGNAVPKSYIDDGFVPLAGGGGGSGAGFVQGGNSFGALAVLGTNDNYGLSFETNNTRQLTIDTGGNVGIGTTVPGAKFTVGLDAFMVTNAGIVSAGEWQGTDIAVAHGGTGTSTGSITGTGALTFTAGGTNENVTLTPSGTGYTILNGNVGIGTTSPGTYKLNIWGDLSSDEGKITTDNSGNITAESFY